MENNIENSIRFNQSERIGSSDFYICENNKYFKKKTKTLPRY